jgi:hypothetical protein
MTVEERRAMGRRARASVLQYSPEAFVARWAELYEMLASERASGESRSKARDCVHA